MKSGVRTSEFYATIIASVVGLLMANGAVPNADADMIVELAERVVGGIIALIALVTYVYGRVKLKDREMQSEAVRNILSEKQEDSIVG